MSTNRWPDAEERAERRVKLHSMLDQYLDAWVDDGGKGGFAKASPVHVEVLDDIVREIIDLKFQRDEDGDQVILPRLINRRFGQMAEAFIPHEPDKRTLGREPTVLDRTRWEAQMSRAISSLNSYASNASDQLGRVLADRLHVLEQEGRIDDARARLTEALKARDVAMAETIVISLCGDPAFKTKMPSPRPLLREGDPRIEKVREQFAAGMGKAVSDAQRMIDHALDRYEKAPLEDRQIEQTAHKLLSAGYERFGRKTFAIEVKRFNDIADAKRAARKAARPVSE